MNYPAQNQNGDAAAYFTAYKFTSLFRWPFRLYGVDLGIDGELEIQDEANTSTGNIIKVQIKSVTGQTNNPKQSYVYPSDAHIEYWKTFSAPVIMCAVDLDRQEVYWTQINETNAYVSPEGKARVAFDRIGHLLTDNSKLCLSKLATPADAHKLRSILNQIGAEIGKAVDQYGNIAEPIGSQDGAEFKELAKRISALVGEAYELAKYYPWKLSLSDHALLERARSVGGIIRLKGDVAICGDFS